jgi:hypothetical protein
MGYEFRGEDFSLLVLRVGQGLENTFHMRVLTCSAASLMARANTLGEDLFGLGRFVCRGPLPILDHLLLSLM